MICKAFTLYIPLNHLPGTHNFKREWDACDSNRPVGRAKVPPTAWAQGSYSWKEVGQSESKGLAPSWAEWTGGTQGAQPSGEQRQPICRSGNAWESFNSLSLWGAKQKNKSNCSFAWENESLTMEKHRAEEHYCSDEKASRTWPSQ